jgi:hypothetical protein
MFVIMKVMVGRCYLQINMVSETQWDSNILYFSKFCLWQTKRLQSTSGKIDTDISLGIETKAL